MQDLEAQKKKKKSRHQDSLKKTTTTELTMSLWFSGFQLHLPLLTSGEPPTRGLTELS